jgi:hypothetical protein
VAIRAKAPASVGQPLSATTRRPSFRILYVFVAIWRVDDPAVPLGLVFDRPYRFLIHDRDSIFSDGLVRLMGMFERLPGELMPRQVILFSMVLRGRHDERARQGREAQPLSDVNLAICCSGLGKGFNPSRFVVRLFGEFIRSIRVFQGALRMPVRRLVIALFVVLGGSAVSLGGEFMVFSSVPVKFVHDTSVHRKWYDSRPKRFRALQSPVGI